jgi:hypothetical protein
MVESRGRRLTGLGPELVLLARHIAASAYDAPNELAAVEGLRLWFMVLGFRV